MYLHGYPEIKTFYCLCIIGQATGVVGSVCINKPKKSSALILSRLGTSFFSVAYECVNVMLKTFRDVLHPTSYNINPFGISLLYWKEGVTASKE